MRVILAVVASAVVLSGCMQIIGGASAVATRDKYRKCMADLLATPEGQVAKKHIWMDDGTDTAEKLSDPHPLTPTERNALVQAHAKWVQCRQIIINHDNQFAAWETQYWQELYQRDDQIFYKLASGEMPVGLANKLIIESNGKFQVDVSKGHADAVRVEEAQRQRAAEAMMQAGAQIAASQPQPQIHTTNCTWLGNTLNCTGM